MQNLRLSQKLRNYKSSTSPRLERDSIEKKSKLPTFSRGPLETERKNEETRDGSNGVEMSRRRNDGGGSERGSGADDARMIREGDGKSQAGSEREVTRRNMRGASRQSFEEIEEIGASDAADVISGRYNVKSATATTTASRRVKSGSSLPASVSASASTSRASTPISGTKPPTKSASSRSLASSISTITLTPPAGSSREDPARALARRVHAACGWYGCSADVEELRQLHVHYDDEIVNLKYADHVWKKVLLRRLRELRSSGVCPLL